MELRIKHVSEPGAKSDGARILVDRLWPRGQSKVKLKLDAWLRDIAPSDALRKWFGHDPVKWDEFRGRYHKELGANPDAVAALQEILREHTVTTLLFAAHDRQHNNAVALADYLQRHMPRRGRR